MPEFDIVRDTAKKILQLQTIGGDIDNSLWDRAQRLERSIEHICHVPEVAQASFRADLFCLAASAYFSEAGLARSCSAAGHPVKTGSSAFINQDLLELSALVAQEKLNGLVSPASIRKIMLIIIGCGDHFTRIPEAMILSDARNLDDMGAVGIFNELREQMVSGKSVSDVLKNWKRKIDYGYWQARLRESFHFEPVRKLAQQRLWAAEQFMNQLNIENAVGDMEEFIEGYAKAKQPQRKVQSAK